MMTATEFDALTTTEINAMIAALSPVESREWSKWESSYLRGCCTNSTDSRRKALRTVLGIKTTRVVGGVTMTY